MNSKIIVALDSNNISDALNYIKLLKNDVFAFKIGYEFFFNFGLDGYKIVKKENIKIFLDLKLNDIPNTVKQGIEAIAKLEPFFTTIHISGGDEMQKKAIAASYKTKILGVSILTSIDSNQSKKYFYNSNVKKIVSDYAKNAYYNKIDGIVCSPLEIELVRKVTQKNFIIVTPGIRPENYKSDNDDQKRFVTPKQAINSGANFVVIGRPITKSKYPLKTVQEINNSII